MGRAYIMPTALEAVFRSLKSELGLRPIYHQKQRRSNGHLFITVLAYQLEGGRGVRLPTGGYKDLHSVVTSRKASTPRRFAW